MPGIHEEREMSANVVVDLLPPGCGSGSDPGSIGSVDTDPDPGGQK
jgi:hypothetical protein